MTTSEGIAQLHPDLRHHIVNTLGWTSLREVQRRAIAPILAGHDAVLLAPTAGGKTEAAFFPLMSGLLEERWPGLSILYLSPIRALLNNQHDRLERLLGMIGHTAAKWHGDVGASARQRLRDHPPTALLTTPESLEAMLISVKTPAESMFGDLRVVVVDEIHAFAGADRGWHLLGVLERLSAYAGRPLQRIGLSATVGNPDEITAWLTADADRPCTTLTPAPSTSEPEVTVDFVGGLSNAARVIAALHRRERRLVFCDSRLEAEKLTRQLRGLRVDTHIIHGSLSADERRRTECSFVEGGAGVIVATSALELGIDIGDLDRVLTLDAPSTVASFLQRMGRTGRRADTTPNMLFLAISEWGLVRAAALLELWRQGHVEPARPPGQPLHILAQQLMALALERPGLPLQQLKERVRPFLRAAHIDPEHARQLLEHLFTQGYLFADGVRVGVGPRGERELGRRHYLELVSVFTTPPLFQVMHGRRELGKVHQSTFARSAKERQQQRPVVILLAGRSWRVTSIAWSRRVAYVEPVELAGKTSWLGLAPPMTAELARAHHQVLRGPCHAQHHWSRRAHERLDELRQGFTFLDPEPGTLTEGGDGLEYWNFAGTHANHLLAARLERRGVPLSHHGPLMLEFEAETSLTRASASLHEARASDDEPPLLDADHPFAEHLKFRDLLPRELLRIAVSARWFGRS